MIHVSLQLNNAMDYTLVMDYTQNSTDGVVKILVMTILKILLMDYSRLDSTNGLLKIRFY